MIDNFPPGYWSIDGLSKKDRYLEIAVEEGLSGYIQENFETLAEDFMNEKNHYENLLEWADQKNESFLDEEYEKTSGYLETEKAIEVARKYLLGNTPASSRFHDYCEESFLDWLDANEPSMEPEDIPGWDR
jgi:hypothetical protein